MSKEGGNFFIKYRDPVVASFSSKDIVLNVQTGTIFYKRNRELFQIRGTPDNFDLVVFPGQTTNQQILINDSSDVNDPIMEGTDQFRFKLASATCGCANYFHIGAETLTHFSGSVRIGEHLGGTCNLLDGEANPALKIYGNLGVVNNPSGSISSSAELSGHIAADGNISASGNLYGSNAYIDTSIFHTGDTDTYINFNTNTINLAAGGSVVATVINTSFIVNSNITASGNISASGFISASNAYIDNNLYIPGTGNSPSTGTAILVMDTTTGEVFQTGSFGGSAGGTNIQALDEGNLLTTAATSFNFVGNAVSASNAIDDITVTINAITKSVWYDGQPTYISSSDNVLIDKNLGVGEWNGNYGDLKHNIHISSSNTSSSIGFTNSNGSHWSTGVNESTDNIFHISDHGTLNNPTGTQVLKIYGTGSGNLLSAPEAISIHSGLRTGGATPNPTFIGATDTTIPSIMIDPVGTGSLAKFHINTMGVDDGLLYNGLCVGPYYNPSVFTNQNSGSGVFIHIGEPVVGDTGDSYTPRITGKTEQGSAWDNNFARGLLITAETDRSINYPGSNPVFGNAVGKSTVMEFKVKDVGKQAYSASVNNLSTSGTSSFTLGGFPDSSSMASVYGTGENLL
jgi:hypothetical protein